jgi:uncharacterized protein YlzI (FlbEa/FlbD family)
MTWKGKDMKSNRFLFQLQVSTHRTNDTEFGLLLTPTCTMVQERSEDSTKKRIEYRKSIGRNTVPAGNLAEQIFQMLPTPTLQEYTNSTIPPSQINRKNLAGHLLREGISAGSQLNPQFVEEMMGFPENWTLLPFLNGEMSQSKDLETL